jgi:ribosomal protein L11 methyltransferase
VPRLRYSRLEVPRKSGDDAIVGLLALHGPLGFETAGKDLVAYFREASSARAASDRLRGARIRHALTTDIPEGDPLETYRARSKAFAVGRRLWIDPGDSASPAPPQERVALRSPRRARSGPAATPRRAWRSRRWRTRRSGRAVLDVGTGSGILALAAAALGRGSRSDSTSTRTPSSWRANAPGSFGARVRLFASPPAACASEFDLVVANLLADGFCRNPAGSRASRRGRSSSRASPASGRRILARLRTGRWKLAGRRSDAEWSCLCLARAS